MTPRRCDHFIPIQMRIENRSRAFREVGRHILPGANQNQFTFAWCQHEGFRAPGGGRARP